MNDAKKSNKKIDNYFAKKARKKARKKIAFLSLVLISITAIVLCKAPFFNVKNVKVAGNKMIKKEGIIDNKLVVGKNIFLLDTNEVRDKVLENPYIKSVEVTREVPSILNVKIEERKMFYKIKSDSKIYILNNELYIMDILEDDENLSLVEIKGLNVDSIKIGEKISSDVESAKILFDIATSLIDKNKDSIFTVVDISKKTDISIFIDGVEIVLGKAENLDEKYKKAMDIIGAKNIEIEEGYIDVSVISQPVIKGNSLEEQNNNDSGEGNGEDKVDEVIEDGNISP